MPLENKIHIFAPPCNILYILCGMYNWFFLLISSSNWQWFCIEALTRGSHRKCTKDNGQLLVARKCLTLGVRGSGEKPSWEETWSSDTGGSHPGQGSWSVSGGEAYIPQSLGPKGNQEGWPILGGVQIKCDRGSTPWSGYFSRPVSKGEALLWGKVQPGVALYLLKFLSFTLLLF